jgi:aminoglycoside-2''-adenylyltransferase
MNPLPEKRLPTEELLRIVASRLKGISEPWAITGSVGLLLQGIPGTPHDLDLQSSVAGIYEIERVLQLTTTLPVSLSETDPIKSHFGRGTLGGWQIELMGDVHKRSADGIWVSTPPLASVVTRVRYAGIDLPVLTLEYEAEAYEALGREDQSNRIRSFLSQL